jgi:hypothetical protein
MGNRGTASLSRVDDRCFSGVLLADDEGAGSEQ